jgi:hypothetical protein
MSDSIIIVVAYDEKIRGVLVNSLARFDVSAIACATFGEAESHMLVECCRGLLVDLVTIVKAKGEEKIVAFTLSSIFPTLRVRTMGSMLVPMTMSGDAKQDKNLNDFIDKTCAEFDPRRFRRHKRWKMCLPVSLSSMEPATESVRGFTKNVSWGGMFVVVMNPEQWAIGEEIKILIDDFQQCVTAEVVWIIPWGGHKMPGVGVKFSCMTEELNGCLSKILPSAEDADHDRLVA